MVKNFQTVEINKNTLMTAHALAQIIGCNVVTVKTWLKNGGAKYTLIGRGNYLIDLGSIKW